MNTLAAHEDGSPPAIDGKQLLREIRDAVITNERTGHPAHHLTLYMDPWALICAMSVSSVGDVLLWDGSFRNIHIWGVKVIPAYGLPTAFHLARD